MQISLRFGDRDAARNYPLPVSVAPLWRVADAVVDAIVPVPPCPGRHILVPSLSIPGEASAFQCALQIGDSLWPLEPVAAKTPLATPFATHSNNGAVSTHIDCFHTESDLPQSRLLVRLAGPNPPKHFLVTLSIRPLQINPEAPKGIRFALAQPAPLSQMTAPQAIRRRICSPTALTMALRAAQPDIDWRSVIDACCDGRFYGSWPLAIRCAGLFGRLGAVETLASWEPALRVLRAGSPVVASIRFGRDELPGAPLTETAGHLVTIYGIHGNRVLACDPAAAEAASVPRSYDLSAFTNAWLRHRGAAYLFAPLWYRHTGNQGEILRRLFNAYHRLRLGHRWPCPLAGAGLRLRAGLDIRHRPAPRPAAHHWRSDDSLGIMGNILAGGAPPQ